MNVEEFEAKLRVALVEVQQRGWRIDCGITIDDGACCPLGALLLADEEDATPDWSDWDSDAWSEIASDHGLTDEESQAFVDGFDGTVTPHGDTKLYPDDSPFFALGAQLRKELLA